MDRSRRHSAPHFALAALGLLLSTAACDMEGRSLGTRGSGEDLTSLEGEPCNYLSGEDPESRACLRDGGSQSCNQESSEFEGVWGPCIVGGECEYGDTERGPSYPDDPCSGLTSYCEVDNEGMTYWSTESCGTPLVLRFDTSAAVEFAPRPERMSADFAIEAGSCTTTDWPTAATPWLVRDLNGDGQISGGHELFGSGTELAKGRFATNGFEALRALNSDGNDRFDAKDAAYAELALWADHDGDRRVGPGELQTLAQAGVVALSLEDEVDVRCDARGNCGKERAAFEFSSGDASWSHTSAGGVSSAPATRMGEIVDVYLPCR